MRWKNRTTRARQTYIYRVERPALSQLASGDRIWPAYSKALREALPQLRQAQLVQRTLDEIEVRLVVASPLTPQEEDRARAAFCKALSDAFAYRFVYVDEIPRSPTGKFEEVKSELDGLDPVG